MERLNWHAVGSDGLDLTTGRAPRPPGASSAAAALASAAIAIWPPVAVAGDGRRADLAGALGEGGEHVESLLERLMAPVRPVSTLTMAYLARATPVGRLDLPVFFVDQGEGLDATGELDPSFLAALEERRSEPREALVQAGRGLELEAALHVAMLLATDRLRPGYGPVLGAEVASGAQLWLLGGAVAWCLWRPGSDPFGPWAELVTRGWWPIGPSRGRLVVAPGAGGPLS